MTESWKDDLRLIEAGFPCHQVGAETQRERGASSALPPLYFLHVWWARRPLTPSRAAILASLLPADTDPDWFLQQLGIEKRVVEINGAQWILTDKVLDKIQKGDNGQELLLFDQTVLNWLDKENERREQNRKLIAELREKDGSLTNDAVLLKWESELQSIPAPWPETGEKFLVKKTFADPAWAKERIAWENAHKIRTSEDKYGYPRAYSNSPTIAEKSNLTVLDPTAGGGSIPFEALRLGYNVIANELNPVASVILHATLEYPANYGPDLAKEIKKWGNKLRDKMVEQTDGLFPTSRLNDNELRHLKNYLKNCPEYISSFQDEILDGFLYCRQVTCSNCGGDAPLLNTCWLSKESGKQWGVKIVPDGRKQHGKVRFETYRVTNGKGPGGEDPNFASVNRGIGYCVHCRQAIDANEVKAQARGESLYGKWQDRLYCVVAVRLQPKLDKAGHPLRYKSGEKKGEIKTEKTRFFRPPNKQDLAALDEAEKQLKEGWDKWDHAGLIPNEQIPVGYNTKQPINFGMTRWSDMFTPRQLLGHLSLIEKLNQIKQKILNESGNEKGRAIVTYLQFAIDKGLDYNSKQSKWENTRAVIKGAFNNHNYAPKWTFGEMIFSGSNSGFKWALNQILDAYVGICNLLPNDRMAKLIINCGSASYIGEAKDRSVDLIVMDPPYYDNVMYSELSDYFYVWHKRTLKELYPAYYRRRLTEKTDEAIANSVRHGSPKKGTQHYEKLMSEIFYEARRILKHDGVMTLMFTHKSQDAWESLTRAIIENGWIITSSLPVDSESNYSVQIMERAAAVSSIFLSCRKRLSDSNEPALWTGIGGTGVQQKIQKAVAEGLKEFEPLKLNPVDEMVASYGRALRVLSEQWPVIDGDEEVGPIRAMNEASRVVSENQIRRITKGRLNVQDLSPEAAMAVTLFGIYRLAEFPYDEALNLSRSLNIALENKSGGYVSNGRFIGYSTQSGASALTRKASAEDTGFHAPLVRKGSKLRLAKPEERHEKRKEYPQTEWDLLYGVILAFREGDIPVARAYLDRHADGKNELIKALLEVWSAETPDEQLKKEAQAIIFGLK